MNIEFVLLVLTNGTQRFIWNSLSPLKVSECIDKRELSSSGI